LDVRTRENAINSTKNCPCIRFYEENIPIEQNCITKLCPKKCLGCIFETPYLCELCDEVKRVYS
jgi:hypothetical protein